MPLESFDSSTHTLEPSLLKILLIPPNLTGTSNTSNIQRHVLRNVVWERLSSQNITDSDPSTRPQESSDFFKDGWLVIFRNEVNDTITNDAVDARVWQWHGIDSCFHKLDVGNSRLLSIFLGEFDHALCPLLAHIEEKQSRSMIHLGHVNADSLSLDPDFTSRQEDVNTTTASKIQDCLAL